jgi:hypothetical protein
MSWYLLVSTWHTLLMLGSNLHRSYNKLYSELYSWAMINTNDTMRVHDKSSLHPHYCMPVCMTLECWTWMRIYWLPSQTIMIHSTEGLVQLTTCSQLITNSVQSECTHEQLSLTHSFIQLLHTRTIIATVVSARAHNNAISKSLAGRIFLPWQTSHLSTWIH